MRGGSINFSNFKKENLNPKTIKRLLSYMKDYKFQCGLVIICILISSISSVASSLFMKTLIDGYIAPLLLEAVPNFAGLLKAITGMAVLYLCGVSAAFFYNRTMAVIAQGILKKIRDQMFSHIETLPISFFDTHTHGDIMSRFTNDADTLRQMISQGVPQIFSSLISITAVFISMLYLSIPLTLFVIGFVLLILQVIKFISKKSGIYFTRQQKSLGDINGYIEEMITGQKVVKVFCHEEIAKTDFDKRNEELRENTSKANTYGNIIMPIMNNLGFSMYVVLSVAGGFMAILGFPNLCLAGVGIITLGTLAAFLQLSRGFINPIAQVSQQLNSIVMAIAGATRIFQLMDEAPEVDLGQVTLVNAKYENSALVECEEKTELWAWKYPHSDGSVTYQPLRGEVNFYDVDFAYESGKTVLHNVTLYAKQGEKLAFVGATGAGKTTITNLINRFYDIADGKISYDGININKIKKADLRRSLGVVLQDVNLFTGTVMENIRYGKIDATDEECIYAAKLTHADSFISMLPQGYNTILTGDGSGLSQGQRQLVSIARAAVADPPLMILDEATSSIDTRTEKLVQHGMDSLMHGRTVFVIAHRLSTVQNSDVIMVLEDGRITERGNHQKLISEKGKYYSLYTGKFELE